MYDAFFVVQVEETQGNVLCPLQSLSTQCKVTARVLFQVVKETAICCILHHNGIGIVIGVVIACSKEGHNVLMADTGVNVYLWGRAEVSLLGSSTQLTAWCLAICLLQYTLSKLWSSIYAHPPPWQMHDPAYLLS